MLHTNQPAQGPCIFFLKIVERAHENKNRGGFLTSSPRVWGWEKTEIDVISFSFSPAGFAGLVFKVRKKGKQLPYRLHTNNKTNKQTADSVVWYFKRVASIEWWQTPPFRILTLTKLQMFLSSKNRFPAKQHQRSVSWTTLTISIKKLNRPANSIELFTRL